MTVILVLRNEYHNHAYMTLYQPDTCYVTVNDICVLDEVERFNLMS